MPTAQQILGLIRSHALGDNERFKALSLQLAEAEERRGHQKLAAEIRQLAEQAVQQAKGANPVLIARPKGELAGIVQASYPKTRINHLILPSRTANQLKRIVEEQRQRWKLSEHGLRPRQKLLLIGPPGSGKTMTAAALAGELGLPLFSILLHGLITKFMGETAAKLRLVFDAIASARGVYLFDEVDAIGAQRNTTTDVGEARRILNSFLQFLDEDQSDSLIVATTNHPELLDRALFRRFHVAIEYTLPDPPLIAQTLKTTLLTFDTSTVSWDEVAETAVGLSNADIIRAAEDAARVVILGGSTRLTTADLVTAVSERRGNVLGARHGGDNQLTTPNLPKPPRS